MFLNFGQATDANEMQSPDAIKAKRALAKVLLERGIDTSPVQHWTQGAARLVDALNGTIEERRADRADKAGMKAASDGFAALLGGASAEPKKPMSSGEQIPAMPTFAAVHGVPTSSKFADMFKTNAEKYGLPADYLPRTAQIESGMNPTAANPNSSAKGMFQFIDGTRAQYGGFDPFDPAASTDAAARLASDNRQQLAKVLGREPTSGELYLAHQQGAGNAAKLLANPNAPAESVLGGQAFRLNGGKPGMTAADFAGKWTGKFGAPVQVASAGGSGDFLANRQQQADQAATPVQQVAQAVGAPVSPATSGKAAKIMQFMSSPAYKFASPGQQKVVEALLANATKEESPNYGFTTVGNQVYRTNPKTGAMEPIMAVPKDPLDQRMKELNVAEKERSVSNPGMETQIIGGNLYERKKGTSDQWKLAVKKSDEDATPKRSLQPIYGTDADGNTVLLQPDDQGNANQMKLPPGVKIASGIDKIDTGTEYVLMDRKTGTVVGRQAKDIRGKEAQEAIGQSEGKIAASAPAAITTAEQTLKDIAAIKSHKSNSDSVLSGGGLGLVGKATRNIPGTDAYGFNQRVEQMKGKTFLEAYNGLRGGGAITDAEGAKATQALARLDAAQSAKDFNAALDDLETVVRSGLERAKKMGEKFGTARPSAEAPKPAAPADGWKDMGNGVRIREKR
jgi:hypothetical protein